MSLTVKIIKAAQGRKYKFLGVAAGVYLFYNTDADRGFDSQFNDDNVVIREYELSTHKITRTHEITGDNWADDMLKLIDTF